jgi:hypothetical protein
MSVGLVKMILIRVKGSIQTLPERIHTS